MDDIQRVAKVMVYITIGAFLIMISVQLYTYIAIITTVFVVLVMGAAGIAIGVGIHWLYDKYEHQKYGRIQLEDEHQLHQADIASRHQEIELRGKYATASLPQVERGLGFLSSVTDLRVDQYTKQKLLPELSPPLLPEVMPEAFELIKDSRKILLIGGENSGKTTMLRQLVFYWMTKGFVFVLDWQTHPDNWPCKVVGHEGGIAEIRQFLMEVKTEIDSRYAKNRKEFNMESRHKEFTIIIDEVPSLVSKISENDKPPDWYRDVMKSFAIEGRKINVNIVMAAQFGNVAATGFKGMNILFQSFTKLHMHYDLVDHNREFQVETSGKFIDVQFTPATVYANHGDVSMDTTSSATTALEPTQGLIESERDKARRLYAAKLPMSDITMLMWGKVGGGYNDRLKKLLN